MVKRLKKENIHRIFDGIQLRDEIDYEFLDFFVQNYEQLFKEEATWAGFITRVYTVFPEISKTSTSNKGDQRHLKVTVEKCKNYIATVKFKNVTSETYHLAKTIGK